MNPFAIVTALMVFMFVLGLIGSEDLREEIDQAREYCEMVEAGAWGAYDKSIDCSDQDKTGIEPEYGFHQNHGSNRPL